MSRISWSVPRVSERRGSSEGICSDMIKPVISVEQFSTAAEKVCRRHTDATVGSPDEINDNI